MIDISLDSRYLSETPQVVRAFHRWSADKSDNVEGRKSEEEKESRRDEEERTRVKWARFRRNESPLLFLDEDSVSGRVVNLYNYCFL